MDMRTSRRDALLGAAALALSACGGGGGGGGTEAAPPPAQPVSSLTIRSSASAAVAGGAGVDLEAVLLNASGPVQWSLEGPGSLSAASGTTVRYTPPPSDEQRVAGRARIVASTRELVQSLALDLTPAAGAAAPEPGRGWDVVSYPKTQTTDLVWLTDRFFAVNVIGGVMDSTDGIGWTPRSTPGGMLWAVAQGSAGFLAVGRDTVLKSADGKTWVDAAPVLPTSPFEFWDVAAGLGSTWPPGKASWRSARTARPGPPWARASGLASQWRLGPAASWSPPTRPSCTPAQMAGTGQRSTWPMPQ
jgi:hypothetical protein